ncbi:MAG: SH2 domain-containing protein, partial [Rhabdochlamydiaceae bacterium]
DLKTGEILYTPSMIPPHELAILIITLDIGHKAMSWKTKEREKLLPKAEAHLQEMAEILKKVFSKIDKLGQITQFHWEGSLENQDEDSILKQTWHDVDREGAERLLLKQQAGTFLFRKDHFAITLQEILRRGLKKTIQCYTLSYLDNEGIVRDKTIVFVNQKWTFYDDDPTLSGPTFRSVGELVRSMGSNTKYPLHSHRVAQG